MREQEIYEKFGEIIFLEGDNDAFNEYNFVNRTLKAIYDRNEWAYRVYDRLYYKTKEEIIQIYVDILSNKNNVSLCAYTTNTKKGQLDGLYSLAEISIKEFKKIKNYESPIKYFIEQYEHRYFEKIAEMLGVEHIELDEELEDYKEFWE